MKAVYAAIMRDDGESGFWAEFPDLPGCLGYGATFGKCAESASNALETHLAAMEADGIRPPDATNPEATDGKVVWFYADTSTVKLGPPSITASDAAKTLGVTSARVSQLIADGRLEARRIGNTTLVSEESVAAYASTPRSPGRPKKEAVMA